MPCRKLTIQELENLNPKPQGFDLQTDCENSTGCGCPEGQMRWWETAAEVFGFSSIEDCLADPPLPGRNCSDCVNNGILGACCGVYDYGGGQYRFTCVDFVTPEDCVSREGFFEPIPGATLDGPNHHPGKRCQSCGPPDNSDCCPQ